MSETKVDETKPSVPKPKKMVSRSVAIALGIVCIVLVAGLVGAFGLFMLTINDKNNTISSLNSQISQLNSNITNLQGQVESYNSTIASLTSQVANLQNQLNLNVSAANYTVVGTLSYANLNEVYSGIIAESIVPNFAPSLVGSLMFLTFNGQLSSSFPEGFVSGDVVVVNGTVSFDEHSHTYFLNWINGSLCNVTISGIDEKADSRLTMTLQKTNFSLSEPIDITLTLTNISNQTVEYSWDSLMFDFRVYNDTNNNLYDWWDTQTFVNIGFTTTLGPGESISSGNIDEALAWPQTCNAIWDYEGLLVSPGTYYIVGYAFTDPFTQTNPILITIAP